MSKSVDFNDYLVENSSGKAKAAIVEPAEQFFKDNPVQEQQEAEADNDLLNPPPVLAPESLHGVLKDVCKISTRYSEASAIAIAANTIATFSAMIGRVAFQHIGDGVCHARPFFLLTGRTGKARKGTSEYTPYRIFNEVERMLGEDHPKLKRHEGGLSTGEGLGWVVHDEILNKDGDVAEEGVNDKRLYVVEAEFAGCMAAASREKNNLSATIRTVWDGKNISPLVKNAKWCASDPHIVISAHITSSELIDRMTDVDAQSGFMNRFIILHIV
jgi:putative DNA primase/helicase